MLFYANNFEMFETPRRKNTPNYESDVCHYFQWYKYAIKSLGNRVSICSQCRIQCLVNKNVNVSVCYNLFYQQERLEYIE